MIIYDSFSKDRDNFMNKKILVTGATGLIGKETLPFLLGKGYEVYATSITNVSDDLINWVECDICDSKSLKDLLEKIKPEYLLHFAWITGGDYLTNETNLLLRDAGENLIKMFKENGGKRAVYAGTCFEYDMDGRVIKESNNLNPKTLYAQCKNELREYCESFAKENNLSFGWGRIFYVYGQNEKSSRLTAKVIETLKNNQEFYLGAPDNYLDYMYTKDIAQAFIALLESYYDGAVNICTGHGVYLKDYVLKIQELMNKQGLIKYDSNKENALNIVGDNTVLTSVVGYTPQYTIETGLREIILNI